MCTFHTQIFINSLFAATPVVFGKDHRTGQGSGEFPSSSSPPLGKFQTIPLLLAWLFLPVRSEHHGLQGPGTPESHRSLLEYSLQTPTFLFRCLSCDYYFRCCLSSDYLDSPFPTCLFTRLFIYRFESFPVIGPSGLPNTDDRIDLLSPSCLEYPE